MAHFARLDSNNIVQEVVVISNDIVNFADGLESEMLGIEFCNSVIGPGRWIQTSYNSRFRKMFAAIGGGYDEANDCFYEPKPFPSWHLNTDAEWEAPIPYPSDLHQYEWNELELIWVKVEPPEVAQEEP